MGTGGFICWGFGNRWLPGHTLKNLVHIVLGIVINLTFLAFLPLTVTLNDILDLFHGHGQGSLVYRSVQLADFKAISHFEIGGT